MEQSDAALEGFDRLKVREVQTNYDHTASAFLAEFQSTAASLEPDEKIKLVVSRHENGVELLKAVLSDPQADDICALQWEYDEEEGVNSVVPLLINNCPELASLQVDFRNHSMLDFVSGVLEHPKNKIKVLEMPPSTEGDSARFFAALGQSQVSVLTLFDDESSEFVQGLFEYLAKDLLEVEADEEQIPSEMSLTCCTRLAELKLIECGLSESTALAHFPKSITKLMLRDCWFGDDFDWSFLADSNVRELDLQNVRGVDGNQLGGALAVQLMARGSDMLCLYYCDFVNETLAAVGLGVGRIKRLALEDSTLDNASLEQICLALKSPSNELRELKLKYEGDTESTIEDQLVPALKHPNCNLVELSLRAYQHNEAANKVEDMFYNRLALFVLLQGQQARRLYCPLRRLPVEMLRLVGQMLL
ncbi:hypothetical protein BASA81_016238 [Batrachochytrium salamandrivorans]|nr:hypothetical protein BASA81_016238 [Batrachochytrium salamandrivorans]